MGGFCCNSGRAWRMHIPVQSRHLWHINFLEFLACIITQLLEIFEGRTKPGDCLLARGDNTSSMGWLHKSNFEQHNKQIFAGLARYYAGSIMANELCTYSQWQAGEINNPADALSRNFTLSDNELTTYLLSKFKNQHGRTANNYRVAKLSKSYLTVLLIFMANL